MYWTSTLLDLLGRGAGWGGSSIHRKNRCFSKTAILPMLLLHKKTKKNDDKLVCISIKPNNSRVCGVTLSYCKSFNRLASWPDFEVRWGRCAPPLRSFCTSPEIFCTSPEKSCNSPWEWEWKLKFDKFLCVCKNVFRTKLCSNVLNGKIGWVVQS
jgi:hypothetical protein